MKSPREREGRWHFSGRNAHPPNSRGRRHRSLRVPESSRPQLQLRSGPSHRCSDLGIFHTVLSQRWSWHHHALGTASRLVAVRLRGHRWRRTPRSTVRSRRARRGSRPVFRYAQRAQGRLSGGVPALDREGGGTVRAGGGRHRARVSGLGQHDGLGADRTPDAERGSEDPDRRC